jgi:hypothetical protein
MAAVLLRECIWKHWRKLKGDVQAQVKTALMKRLLVEPHRLVRLALCGLISAIARYLVPQAKWNDLIGMQQANAFTSQPTNGALDSHSLSLNARRVPGHLHKE